MKRETQIYTELYMTLTRLNKDSIDRIPEELKEIIINNADTSYPYKINELLPETQALLATIIDKYLTE